MKTILTVAAVIANPRGEVLLVRKRGSAFFIQPGGKLDAGEAPLAALARELDEELGVQLDSERVHYLGEFEADAVNEPGRRVRAQAWCCEVRGTPTAHAEIEQLAWLDPRQLPPGIAPLSARHILPAYLAALDGGVAPMLAD